MILLAKQAVSFILVLLLQLSATLSLPQADTLKAAPADGTVMLTAAEQSGTRGATLAASYYKQYYNPVLKRLSFFPYSTRTASCWEYIGLISLTYKRALTDSSALRELDGILTGLRHYRREYKDGGFAGYAVNWNIRRDAPASEDIAYDDNMWLGRDFVSLYQLTGDEKYKKYAIEIADWLIAEAYQPLPAQLFTDRGWATPTEPVGSFYWSYDHGALHTCSTGPAAQFLAALYTITQNESYLDHAKSTYNLLTYLENEDGVFHDLMGFQKDENKNILAIDGFDRAVYPYNSGSPITAAVELYRITDDARYLADAKHWAKKADAYFARETDVPGVRHFPGHNAATWFNLILLNGYTALLPYAAETAQYIENMRGAINYGYDNYRSKGLCGINENILPQDWYESFPKQEGLYQCFALDVGAAAEIYATLYAMDTNKLP